MAHNVESMAWTGEVPWHGLGFKVDGKQSVPQMLKAAKINWKVERRPMFLGGAKSGTGEGPTSIQIEGFAALVRDSDNSVLDVVGSQYTPVQNEQAFEFFNDFVKAGKATMETAGSLKGGRIVWGLANLGQGFTLPGGDKINGYLLCVCPHEQGKSNIFKVTTVRVVCNNTLNLALNRAGAEHRRTHRGEFSEVDISLAKERLGLARDTVGDFEKTALRLVKKKMSADATLRTLLPIFSKDTTPEEAAKKTPPRIEAILQAIEKAPGATPGTAWGVLNGVTYWADHMASRSADKRLQNAWLGRTANQKEAVLAALLDA